MQRPDLLVFSSAPDLPALLVHTVLMTTLLLSSIAVDAAAPVVAPPGPSICLADAQSSACSPYPVGVGQVFRDCADVCPDMVVIPAGRFFMGASDDDAGPFANQLPQHIVRLAQPLAVGRFHVTREEFAASGLDASEARGCRPDFPQTDRHPAVCVSWVDAKFYVDWLSRRTGRVYRLLSEAEWEYAARAGSPTEFWEGAGSGSAACNGCGSAWDHLGTSPAGMFRPNAFGLHDMIGNAWQWVEDCYADSYDDAWPDASIVNRSGDCGYRVRRGGSWRGSPFSFHVAHRSRMPPHIRNSSVGFRVAREAGG